MKNKVQKQKTYRSYIATMKRKHSDDMFTFLKQLYCQMQGIPYRD